MECILYCSQQGITLRGHDEGTDAQNPGNFKALMILMSRHCQEVRHRFQHYSKSASWLSPTLQNEIVVFLANEVKAFIKEKIHAAKYFTVMADETKDISKREQLSIGFRYLHDFKIVDM